MPPICRIAHDDVGQFQFPRRLFLPADLPSNLNAQLIIFARNFGGLQLLKFQLLVFAAESVNLLEQFAARQDGIDEVGGQLLRGPGEAEQREKPASGARLRAWARSKRAPPRTPPRRAPANFFV